MNTETFALNCGCDGCLQFLARAREWAALKDLTAEEAADVNRVQSENADRWRVATDGEKNDVFQRLNDFHPDVLRDAMNETGSNR